jgi:hypothetical protein
MTQDLTQEDIEMYELWDRLYPERYSPGETPTGTKFYIDEIVPETAIQRRIRDMITHGKKFPNYIDARWTPEIAPKQYYSDGIKVDWHNLKRSNQEYRKRCSKHEFGIPGIEELVIYKYGTN